MESPPTFADALIDQLLMGQVEKALFRGKFIRLGPLLAMSGLALELGALLGRAYHDRVEPFLTAFAVPSGSVHGPAQFIEMSAQGSEWLAGRAAEGATFEQACVEAFMTEVQSLKEWSGVASRWSSLLTDFARRSSSIADSNWSGWRAANEKLPQPLDLAWILAKTNAHAGAAFGVAFPDEVATMFTNTEGQRQGYRLLFAMASRRRSDTPDTTSPEGVRTLEECTRDVQITLARFCSIYRPHSLAPLALEALV